MEAIDFFKTFEDVEKYIEGWKQAHTPLKIRDAETVIVYNQKVKTPEYRLDPALKYYSITYTCKHFGTYKSRGKGLRKTKAVLACGCKFFISFKYERLLKGFRVAKKFLTHNHEIGPEYSHQYPENRRLDTEEQQEVLDLLRSGTKPKMIRKIMQEKTSKNIILQDVQNIRKRNRVTLASRPLTQYDKYRKVILLSHKIADAASLLPDAEFRKNFKTLEYILECLQKKETLEIYREDTNLPNDNAHGSESTESGRNFFLELETAIQGVSNQQDNNDDTMQT